MTTNHQPSNRGELVYLLHGLWAKPNYMDRLQQWLQEAGFHTRNWGYATGRSIDRSAAALRADVQRTTEAASFARVHFVAHSLGGIVVREAARSRLPLPLGRLVMLAPPNGGSRLARLGAPLLGKVFPVLHDLSTRADSFVNRMSDEEGLDIGVIAARGDKVVHRRATHLPHQTDHIVLRGDHLRLPFLKPTADQTIHFLRHGQFARQQAKRRRLPFSRKKGRQAPA